MVMRPLFFVATFFVTSVIATSPKSLESTSVTESGTCVDATDASDLEVQGMKTELLQRGHLKNHVATQLGLQQRKAELEAELRSIEMELHTSELDSNRSGGSCKSYGCSGAYAASQSCQCNPGCSKHGNCCSDIKYVCPCAKYGCNNPYSSNYDCQCNSECSKFGNCCSDYSKTCSGGGGGSSPSPSRRRSPSGGGGGSAAGACGGMLCGMAYNPSFSCQCNADCLRYDNCCFDYLTTCEGGGGGNSPRRRAPAPRPLGSLPFGHPSPSKNYPTYPGFTLWLVEEFDSPLDLDNDPIWTWSDGGLREGKVRFVKEGVTFSDGKMKITVKQNDGSGNQQSCSHAATEKIAHKELLSGELRTKHNMFRYGRYEMSFKSPSVQPGNTRTNGNYIATMFIYRDINMDYWREIDWEITADGPSTITSNVLYADHTSQWSEQIQKSVHGNYPWVNTRSGFHEYAFVWVPDSITWFIDGKQIRTLQKPAQIPEKSTKIMMNLWIFEGYHFGGKDGRNNRYPFHSEYDWFRFYKYDKDNQYPCSGMGESCLTTNDKLLSGNNPCDGIEMVGRWPYGKCTVDTSICHRR